MNLREAIELRVARRNYSGEAIDAETAAALQRQISVYNEKAGINIQLLQNQGAVLDSERFTGGNGYLLLAGRGGDLDAGEKLGYYGELLVLEAVCRGLGTCWISGTYNGRAIRATIAGNERVFGVIALGKLRDEDRGGDRSRETVFGKVSHRQTKALEEFYTASGKAPDWFLQGIDAVQKAPSAMNTQPVFFTYEGGVVRAEAKQAGRSLDLGIAKAHFEIGAGGGVWEWGNGGAFRRNP